MYLLNGIVVTSASDLKKASDCEFAFLRELDVKLGRDTLFAPLDDPMLRRAGELGDAHELRVLERYRAEFGPGVVEIDRPDVRDAEAVAAATNATIAAFEAGAPVVFQATFSDEPVPGQGFIGFADFIVRQPDGRYRVQDSKLARHARVTALLQLAAYAEQLTRLGVPLDDTVELLLGDGSVSAHRLDDILPVYRERIGRLQRIVADRVADAGPVAWGDPLYTQDGRCPTCELEVQANRDVLMVGGLRVTQREPLAAAGITTIDALAASHDPVPHVMEATLDNLRAQARLQLRAEVEATEAVASGAWREGDPPLPPPVGVRDARAIAAIPEPSPGDLFFDFEGDPLYTEGDGTKWNLDYLWGMVDNSETYTAFWAHSFAEERVALERFLEFVKLRRQVHPDLHIFHYASYERTHLTSIAARHGVGEAEVDQLLADGVLVDLYPIVKRAVRVGSRSYSIKKLEPLYMGSELREADVKSGADSITEYVRAGELQALALAIGPASPVEAADAAAEAARILDDLADYNRYDCVSTLRLRDWLLAVGAREGVRPVAASLLADRAEGKIYEASPLALQLKSLVRDREERAERSAARAGGVATAIGTARRDADTEALALASAAIDYHAREAKSFWWSHYLRCDQPIESWEEHRDVLVVDPARSRAIGNWYEEPRWNSARRELLLDGRIAPGSRFSVGGDVFLLYDWPAPFPSQSTRPGQRAWSNATVVEVTDAGVRVEERGHPGITWRDLPLAIAPGAPPRADALRDAIAEWAAPIPGRAPELPLDPAMDILRRRPPRAIGGLAPLDAAHDYQSAVVESVRRLERSYLAVQGPPGTGKTYLAAHVIAALVRDHGWRIGVVAQSHSVVENVLDSVVNTAGLDGDLVAKHLKDAGEADRHGFTALARKDDVAAFAAERPGGYVIGGTAWDFCNVRRIPRASLDLLVIDEAGQFSLASTIAVSVSAKRLLLLGDPQQLPQVSQALHPEPVNASALGWVADGHDVLPPEYGYFLAESRRMHPAVAAPVSRLSYEGELRSHPVAAGRALEGVAPGVTPIPVEHEGNSTFSPEEADAVVHLVRSLIGRDWTDATDSPTGPAMSPPRPLDQRDLIVVTPYNAQLGTVREALDAAGFADVPVGTVDKFQGQEAVVAIVSLAASSAASAPRGLEFLLLKNRLNVAISRAKWAAYLVYSPGLLDGLPHRAEGVAQLSAFMRLVDARGSRAAPLEPRVAEPSVVS
ncbi:TM0106 family RecB-like putative nuclease [Agromyces sp. H3Y2-19a]|uniref:TM0106 family RecB-like putative nuclease n=1 Tax=Agromyces TaxID=33877 RepID=UPI001E5FBDCF|nr:MULTISPECIES: bifunctional RecB family nuclease/DEAD/DEAH box helicase [Agromyces]MCD5345950.1 TM0106 family RecB-like putative nuclease [Agromyces sp. S2-1-8]MDF0512318.1 TM0106 family RecB-like putative nuclease [Agromyces chromiiresistens]